jgi:hypothetical protein
MYAATLAVWDAASVSVSCCVHPTVINRLICRLNLQYYFKAFPKRMIEQAEMFDFTIQRGSVFAWSFIIDNHFFSFLSKKHNQLIIEKIILMKDTFNILTFSICRVKLGRNCSV